MIQKQRRYTREFKQEAVRLAEESERSMASVARDLGIHPNNLYRWRQELVADGEEAYPGKGKVKKSDEEARQLRRELVRVRQERDILKKALLYFTKEQG